MASKDADLTDCHIDGSFQFIGSNGNLLVEAHYHRSAEHSYAPVNVWQKYIDDTVDVFRGKCNANGNAFTIHSLPGIKKWPWKGIPVSYHREGNYHGNAYYALLSYANLLVVNGAVITGWYEQNEEINMEALSVLKRAYAGKKIHQLNLKTLFLGGGGIHCSTQQQWA